MKTFIAIILGLLAVILALVVLAASLYLAIVLYHEARWRQIKSERYEQHNDEPRLGDNRGREEDESRKEADTRSDKEA